MYAISESSFREAMVIMKPATRGNCIILSQGCLLTALQLATRMPGRDSSFDRYADNNHPARYFLNLLVLLTWDTVNVGEYPYSNRYLLNEPLHSFRGNFIVSCKWGMAIQFLGK